MDLRNGESAKPTLARLVFENAISFTWALNVMIQVCFGYLSK